MHPKLPRLIAGGTHHSALGRGRADNHRSATQLRVVALFHGSVKRVHVEMKDHTKHRSGKLQSLSSDYYRRTCTVLAYARTDEMTKLFYDTINDLYGKE